MSGILDKFLILFESDAADAKKDIDGLNSSLGTTEETAGKTTKASSETSKQFLGMGKTAWAAIGGITALTTAFAGLFVTMDRMRALEGFASILEEDIQEVDAWAGAVYRMGGSTETFKSTIGGLQTKLTDASIRGYNDIIPYFHQMGISILDASGKVKSAFDLLPEIADRFEGYGKRRSFGLGQKLGLDIATIKLLSEGTEGVEYYLKRQKELGLVNQKAGELAFKYGLAIKDFTQTIKYSAQQIFVVVAPAITFLINRLTDINSVVTKNKPILIGFFVGLGLVAIPILYNIAIAAWAAVAPMIAMTAVALAAATPFILLGAAVIITSMAIAALVEDIIAFSNGQDSVLGRMAEKWGVVSTAIKWIVNDVKDLIHFIKQLVDVIALINNILPEVKFSGLEGIDTLFSDKALDLGIGNTEARKLFNSDISLGKFNIDQATNNPIASQTSNSIQNSNRFNSKSTAIQIGDINIETQSTDPGAIASEIAGSLKNEVRSMIDNADDGIDR
jgi:hypothetical protein